MKINMYRTINSPVVLYGNETLSLTLREQRGLRVFKNRVLRILRSTRDKVRWEWRRLYNGELNDLYSSQNTIQAIKSRRMKWVRYVVCKGAWRGA
jgi:hypothetical protein